MRVITCLRISVLLLLCSCGEESTTRVAPKPKSIHSVVFLDKSFRTGPDSAYAHGKYARFLNQLVAQNLRFQGDRFRIYDQTGGTPDSPAYDLEVLSTVGDTSNLSPVDAETARLDFTSALKVERGNAFEACTTHLLSPSKTGSSPYPDIWGSMNVLAAGVDTNAITKVYYLSGMIERMKGKNRRDFRLRPPQNRTEATDWAARDATYLRKNVPQPNWRSIELYMVLPFSPMRTTRENNPAITHYWEELFRQLGVPGSIKELHP